MGNKINIPKEVYILIASMLNEQELLMVHFSDPFFHFATSVDHRCKRICMKSAIKNKSISYIRFTEKITEELIDIEEYFNKIIKSNDLEFIKSLIDITDCERLIEDSSELICKRCDYPVLSYLFENSYHLHIRNIISCGRIDVINNNEYVRKEVNKIITSDRDYESIMLGRSLKFLKYMVENRFIVALKHINFYMLMTNSEYTKWVCENLDMCTKDITSIFYQYFNICCDIPQDVILFLIQYDSSVILINEVYEIAYKYDMLHVVKGREVVRKVSAEIIIHDASKNIFNRKEIEEFYELGSAYDKSYLVQIFYFIVKYNRFDLYNLSFISTIKNIKEFIYLCKRISFKQFCMYLSYNENDSKEYKVEDDIYMNFPNDTLTMKIYFKKFKINFFTLMSLYEAGNISLCYYFIDNPNMIVDNTKYVDFDVVSYVFKKVDLKMLKYMFLFCSGVNKQYFYKYCKLNTLIKIGVFGEDENNDALMWGHDEVIEYVIGLGKFNCFSLHCAYYNSIKVANRLLTEKYYNEIGLELCRYYFKICSDDVYMFNEWIIFINVKPSVKCLDIYFDDMNEVMIKYIVSNVDVSEAKRDILRRGKDVLDIVFTCVDLNFSKDDVVFMIEEGLMDVFWYLIKIGKCSFPENISEIVDTLMDI